MHAEVWQIGTEARVITSIFGQIKGLRRAELSIAHTCPIATVNQELLPSPDYQNTMNQKLLPTVSLIIICMGTLMSCGEKLEEKGFAVSSPGSDQDGEEEMDGILNDSASFPTRPSNVLLTGDPRYRLATIYKINYTRDSATFIGENSHHFNYEEIGRENGNQWHYHYLPGFEVVYGYNLVNVAHYDIGTQKQKLFFEKPVLVRNLYYPSFSRDTLNYRPVKRDYFMISVHDADTNHDGYINVKDLRRFYHLDLSAATRRELIPVNYSVYKSEYDPANDFVYIFAQLDENANGQIEDVENVHIFWIDLKNPANTGKLYQ